MAKPLHDYDVDMTGRVTDPSNPGGRPDKGDDIQDQYNQLGGMKNPGRGGDEYYWGGDELGNRRRDKAAA